MAAELIQFDNNLFGRRFAVPRAEVVRVPDGLIGVPAARRFAMTHRGLVKELTERTGKLFTYLLDLDDPARSLVLTRARDWWPPVEVSEELAALVDATPEQIFRLVIVDTSKGLDALVGDFRRPLLLNLDTMLAMHADLGEKAEAWQDFALVGGGA